MLSRVALQDGRVQIILGSEGDCEGLVAPRWLGDIELDEFRRNTGDK
jgi:hypothetical protein